MKNNYLEKLRFTLILENINDKKINPEISVGINGEKNHFFKINSDINTFTFDEVVYKTGKNCLTICVETNDNNIDSFHSFIIKDLKIHGISVTKSLYHCEYFPVYSKEHLLENPDAVKIIKSGLYMGNAGKWCWYFDSPIKENVKYKFGLW